MENLFEVTLTNMRTGSSVTRRTSEEALDSGSAEAMIASMKATIDKTENNEF